MIQAKRGALKGEDLFVCATGPSILEEDTSLLQGKIVMGLSELFNWEGRDFECSLWGWHVSGDSMWERYGERVSALPKPVFVTLGIGALPDDFPEEDFVMIPKDESKPLAEGHSNGTALALKWVASSPCSGLMVGVQPAIWLRPKNIYLLGFDHTSTGYAHSPGGVKRASNWDEDSQAFTETMEGLEVLLKVCKKLKINLVNLSQGTRDTVLPTAKLKDVV